MRIKLIRIFTGAVLLVLGLLLRLNSSWVNIALFIAAYLAVGFDVVIEAISNIFKGHMFDENFLMSIATIGAFCIKQFPEAVMVMLLYQIGEMFQTYAITKSRKSIADLMNIRPDSANLMCGDSVLIVNPEDVKINDCLLIRAGEKVPLDGVIISGMSTLDTSALTGESLPCEVTVGDEVMSGCLNQSGMLTLKVTKTFRESTVSKILDLVENASSKKSTSENFITKFATVYTPIVVIAAFALAVIPPLIIPNAVFSDWLYRALTFLVVSCPCALVISVPLSFFCGIGGASKTGILIKGGNYLEALANTQIVVFDKTGTLTQGIFEVKSINACGIPREKLLEYAAYAEINSTHPISRSIVSAYNCANLDASRIGDVEENFGYGVCAVIDGLMVLVGNEKLMEKYSISHACDNIAGTAIHVALDGVYVGYIVIADKAKVDAKAALEALKLQKIKQTIMLTGDNRAVGEAVAKELGIDSVYSELLPADKVEKLEMLLAKIQQNGKLAFVGDGVNDAPVLARADVGVAMGGLGSDAAIEAADVVIMTDEPSKLPLAIKISKKTLRIVKQNICLALTVKVGVLVLSAAGIANMWAAVFADVGVSVLAIINALRALHCKNGCMGK